MRPELIKNINDNAVTINFNKLKLHMYNLPSLLGLHTFTAYYFTWKDIYLTLHSFTEF